VTVSHRCFCRPASHMLPGWFFIVSMKQFQKVRPECIKKIQLTKGTRRASEIQTMYFVRVSYIQANKFTQLCNYALQYTSFIQESRCVFFLSECVAELLPVFYVCTCKGVVFVCRAVHRIFWIVFS
jgi:hypothetical protein